MHELGVVVHRGLEVDDGRKGVVVDRDQAGRLLGDLGRDRGHAGDDVALPANLLLREEPPVLDHPPVLHVRDVLVRQNGEYPTQRARLRGVDAGDARVGVIRVAELRVELAGQVEVGRVPARARHLLDSVRPDRLAPEHRAHSGPPAFAFAVRGDPTPDGAPARFTSVAPDELSRTLLNRRFISA